MNGRWRPSVLPGGYSFTGKTPPLPWRSCSISACGGWAYRYPSFPPAVLSCWRGWPRQRKGIWWFLFSFSKLSREGRILLDHSRSAGYRTLAFVGRTCLPAEERADISLFAYRGTEKEYHSMAAPAALLDALAVACGRTVGNRRY